MRYSWLFFLTCLVGFTSVGQTAHYTTLSSGEKVVLYGDKTWDYRKDFQINKIRPTLLSKPSFTGNTLDSGQTVAEVSLKQVSSEPSDSYKPDGWLKRNDLTLNTTVYHISKMNYRNVPNNIPNKFQNSLITQHLTDSNYQYIVYAGDENSGRYLVIMNQALDSVISILDFYHYQKAPVSRAYGYEGFDFTSQGIAWLSCINDTLYVSTHHRTYSDSSEGKNAFITCIDLKTNQVIWRSNPLISNAITFAQYGEYLFTGYGFTEEDDFIYGLNRYTGAVVMKYSLSKAPEYIIERNDQLHVKSYNKNYIFDIIIKED